MTYAVQVNSLSKKIGEHTILNKISMQVKNGDIYGFLGANGAGKTSLMKSIFQMMIPDSGEVLLWNKPVSREYNGAFAQIGSIIETPVFYGNFDARKNLHLHAEYMGAGHERIDEMLSLFDLATVENKPVKNFSLGMKQWLALARAILTKPKLHILDEPMNGLDPQGINAMRELLAKINREDKITILISSHILSELEKIAGTIGVIDKGILLAEMSVIELRKKGISLENYYLDLLKGVNSHEKVNQPGACTFFYKTTFDRAAHC